MPKKEKKKKKNKQRDSALISSRTCGILMRRHGIRRYKRGARMVLVRCLEWVLNQHVRQAMLAADGRRQRSLREEHAREAAAMIPEISFYSSSS